MSPVEGDARTEQPLLRVRGLHKSFGGTKVLRGINLDLPKGSVLALIGPSGSGKTTVLRSLNGLEMPDAGTVDLAGARVNFAASPGIREFSQLRDRSAMVFQHYHLFPHLTVLQNIIEGPVRVQRRPRDEAVAEAQALLERVGLDGRQDAHPFELSGGQQQRVGIVRALALRPQLLLFDEPTSALDPELVSDILEVIRELAAQGWTMLLVTHELGFAQQTADQVAFMDEGVIVEHGPAQEVLSNPQTQRTRRFLQRLLR